MIFLSVILYIALAEVMLYFGHSWQSPAFWLVMLIGSAIDIISFARGRSHANPATR